MMTVTYFFLLFVIYFKYRQNFQKSNTFESQFYVLFSACFIACYETMITKSQFYWC